MGFANAAARRSPLDAFWLVAGVLLSVAIELVAWKHAASGTGRVSYATYALALAPIGAILAYRWPVLFPYALYVVLVPFNTLLSVSQHDTITKVLGMASAAALLFWAVRNRTLVMPPRALLPCVALVAWMLASLAWALDYKAGYEELKTMFQLVVLFAIVGSFPSGRREFSIALWATVAGGLIAALYGIWVFHHPNALEQQAQLTDNRLMFQVGRYNLDINLYADSLFLPLGILAMTWLRLPFGWRKALTLAGIGTLVVAIYFAASREALIGVVAMLLYFAWKSPHRKQLFIPLGLIVGGFMAIPNMMERLSQSAQTGGAGRLSIWHVGLISFLQHPLFGTGVGSFATAYDDNFLKVFQRYYAGWNRAPHNLFIHYGVENGIVGIAIVLAVWYAMFRMVRVVGKEHPMYEMQIMFSGIFVALFIGSMFVDLFSQKELWLAFCLAAQYRAMMMVESPRLRWEPPATRGVT